MSDVSKTNEALIAEAQEHYSEMNGLNSRAAEVMMELVAALESATRVSAIDPAMIERFKTGWNAANNMDLFGGRVHAGLVAALDGAPGPEWEYAWAGTDELGDDWIGDAVFDSVAEARTFFNHSTWVRTQSGELVRRHKAGPWEPIKGESDD